MATTDLREMNLVAAGFVILSVSGASDSSSSSDSMSFSEAKKLMRLVNMEALKRKLAMENEEVIGYNELLDACEGMGVLRTKEEMVAFAEVLDDAGVVLLFRDKVYLHPDKLDGILARKMGINSVFGSYRDPLVDKVLIVVLL